MNKTFKKVLKVIALTIGITLLVIMVGHTIYTEYINNNGVKKTESPAH